MASRAAVAYVAQSTLNAVRSTTWSIATARHAAGGPELRSSSRQMCRSPTSSLSQALLKRTLHRRPVCDTFVDLAAPIFILPTAAPSSASMSWHLKKQPISVRVFTSARPPSSTGSRSPTICHATMPRASRHPALINNCKHNMLGHGPSGARQGFQFQSIVGRQKPTQLRPFARHADDGFLAQLGHDHRVKGN